MPSTIDLLWQNFELLVENTSAFLQAIGISFDKKQTPFIYICVCSSTDILRDFPNGFFSFLVFVCCTHCIFLSMPQRNLSATAKKRRRKIKVKKHNGSGVRKRSYGEYLFAVVMWKCTLWKIASERKILQPQRWILYFVSVSGMRDMWPRFKMERKYHILFATEILNFSP